jgi:hypothetical protein
MNLKDNRDKNNLIKHFKDIPIGEYFSWFNKCGGIYLKLSPAECFDLSTLVIHKSEAYPKSDAPVVIHESTLEIS